MIWVTKKMTVRPILGDFCAMRGLNGNAKMGGESKALESFKTVAIWPLSVFFPRFFKRVRDFDDTC